MMYTCALWSEAEGGVRGDLEIGPTDAAELAHRVRQSAGVLLAVPKDAQVQGTM